MKASMGTVVIVPDEFAYKFKKSGFHDVKMKRNGLLDILATRNSGKFKTHAKGEDGAQKIINNEVDVCL